MTTDPPILDLLVLSPEAAALVAELRRLLDAQIAALGLLAVAMRPNAADSGFTLSQLIGRDAAKALNLKRKQQNDDD